MEKYMVLGQLFGIAETIKKNQSRAMQKGVPMDDIKKEIHTLNLSHSAKRILHTVFLCTSINQRTIAANLHISAQAVSETINKLVAQKLVEKSAGPLNNENFIVLTENGHRIAERLDAVIRRHAERILCNFTDNEIQNLYSLLEKLQI